MQLVMALSAEYHGFAVSLHHLAFPRFLSSEVPQFPDMMYFDLPLPRLAPFTGTGEQALAELGPVLVHPGVRFEVHLLGRTQSLFELAGRGEQFVLLFQFPLLFQSECVPP